jgi:hypothetical protein
MKNILYSIFAIALAVPAMASAATFSFAPTTATYAPSKTFSVAVFVNPSAGETITTAKLSLKIPADMLEVVSFTPTTGWIALPLPGSDLVDNVNGKLIKTGGYPAKVTSVKQFGTIVFKTKASGSANISTNADSMLIDTTNADKYVSANGPVFTIAKPAPKPKPKPTVTTKPKVEKTTTAETTSVTDQLSEGDEEATTTEEVATTTEIDTTGGQTAAVSETGGFFTTKTITISLLLLALLIAGLFFWKRKSA